MSHEHNIDFVPADNDAEVRRALARFILDNAPAGLRPRDRARHEDVLAEGKAPDYFGFEFDKEDDRNLQFQLYCKVETDWDRFEDPEGNHWRKGRVVAEVSWPSWGSADADLATRRVEYMLEGCRFAKAIQEAFQADVWTLLSTAEERAENKKRAAREAAAAEVRRLIRMNYRGMKVGQERRVEAGTDADFDLDIGEVDVERTEGGRTFKYRAIVTSTRAFYFTRVA